jgi:preprotein translocase subunit SecY
MSATGLGMAWLGLSDSASDSSSGADVSISSQGLSSSIFDTIGNALTYVPRWIAAQVSGAENTVLLALVILAILIIAVIALIGFAPNVRHIIPHFA